jgi:hypothetical protein
MTCPPKWFGAPPPSITKGMKGKERAVTEVPISLKRRAEVVYIFREFEAVPKIARGAK